MKKYFYFSQSQKIGISILLFLILSIILAHSFLPQIIRYQSKKDEYFIAKADSFMQNLQEKEALKKKTYYTPIKTTHTLFSFDPNNLDSIGFSSLGLPTYAIKNILKYRSKGGKFKSNEDFKKIYGISEELYTQLESYIYISTIKEETSQKPTKKEIKNIEKTFSIIELNTADSLSLQSITGSSLAKRIIKYRDILGGYAHIEQLKEIYGMKDYTYEKISPYLKIDTTFIKKIDINKASIEKLKAHPYLNFYQAKAIIETRNKLGKISHKKDLENLKEFSEEQIEKIYPYLLFEK